MNDATSAPQPADAPDNEATRHAWARYWQTGALHSCATSFAGNYDGPIGAFWRDVFGALAPADRVLDVASGNGPLAQLLLATRSESAITCDSVDLAPVSPPWLAQLPPARRARVRFFGGTRAEALPFDDGGHALAVSQFGLEYSDLEGSVPELLRVLARPGRFAAVMHHAESRPVALATEEAQHIAWALAPGGGLFACATAMLRPMSRAATEAGRRALATDAAALAARERFNTCQRELTDRAARSPCPDLLFELREAIAVVMETAARHGEAAARTRLAGVEQAVRDDGARLADLRGAALDEAAMQSLLARFGRDAQHHVEPLRHGGHLMGWAVRITLR